MSVAGLWQAAHAHVSLSAFFRALRHWAQCSVWHIQTYCYSVVVLLLIQIDCCSVNLLLLIRTRYLNSVFYCWYKHCLNAVFYCWYKRTVAMSMFYWWYKNIFEIWVLCCYHIPNCNVIVLLVIQAHCCSVDVLFLVRKMINSLFYCWCNTYTILQCRSFCADTNTLLQFQSLIAGSYCCTAIVLLCKAHYSCLLSNEGTQTSLCWDKLNISFCLLNATWHGI